MIILNPDYDTAIHYHISTKMLHILQWTVAKAQRSWKNYMLEFIDDQSARHLFKSRKTKVLEYYVEEEWVG